MSVAVTIDVDWAPDFMIDHLAGHLIERQVKATWFITHPSAAIDRLGSHGELFELGIHPNFQKGSTQGDSPAAILRYCMGLVPNARSMRTHGLAQSAELLDMIAANSPIEVDLSIYMPRAPHLTPVAYSCVRKGFVRIPYVWEDEAEMAMESPWWHLQPVLELGEGLKVLNFHPMHVYLNLPDLATYTKRKNEGKLYAATSPQTLSGLIHRGPGPRSMFLEAIDHLSKTKEALRACEISRRWQETQRAQRDGADRPGVDVPGRPETEGGAR